MQYHNLTNGYVDIIEDVRKYQYSQIINPSGKLGAVHRYLPFTNKSHFSKSFRLKLLNSNIVTA